MVALEYTGHATIHFDDHSYRWIKLRRFAWDGHGCDTDVLAALVTHRHYRDTFLTHDSHEEDAVSVHGPYHLAAITAGAFEAIAPAGASAVIEGFCLALDEPMPRQETQQEIASAVLSRFVGASCYRLRALPEAVHEWGAVLWEFRELVALSRANGEVTVVAMAID